VLGACAGAPEPQMPSTVQWNDAATQEVRAQVEKTLGAFASMDVEGVKAVLAEEVVAFDINLDSKPVRMGSRADAGRYAEGIFAQAKKMGASLKLDIHSSNCRATSTLAYCTEEFDFKATMPDGSTMSQPSRASIVLRKGDDGWKWTHWHTSLAVLPAPPPSPAP
jgi:ketosteroid isomerase-like protein